MSYFELQFSANSIHLKVLKEPRALLSSLDLKSKEALGPINGKEILAIDPKTSLSLLTILSQKQAVFYQNKLLYADPYNPAKVFHELSYDGTWHFELLFEISNKHIKAKETSFHRLGRWVIHKSFLYPLDSGVDKRSLEIPSHEIEVSSIKKWIEDPSLYPYADNLILDETISLFEDKPLQVSPVLEWVDYAWTEARITKVKHESLALFQKDLLDLGASVKSSPNGQIRFSWQTPEKLYEAMEFLLESGWTIQGPKEEKLQLLEPIEIQKITKEAGEIHIQAHAKIKNGSSKAPYIGAGALSHYLKRSSKYIPLDEKTWLLLPPASKHPELIQGQSRGDRLAIEPWRLQTLKNLPSELLSGNLKNWAKLSDIKDASHVESSLGPIHLRDYQKQGTLWMLDLANLGIGGLLADEMGLGKTIQTLAFLKALHKEPGSQDIIVAPRSLVQTWKAQIKKLLGIEAHVHHGDQRDATSENLTTSALIITTYQTLRQDFHLLSKTHETPWRVAIFDECHLWRNPQTQGYSLLEKLAANMKIGLSGTPIYNSLDDLWYQLRLFAPQIIGEKPDNLKESIQELRALWLRRSKEEVAKELPDKIEETLWLEMGSKQQEVYEKLLSTTLKEEEGKTASTFQILEKILRLRQCCLLPSLIDSSCQDIGVKAEQLLLDLEILLSEERSVLIFSQFATVLKHMYELSKDKWSCHYIDSHTQKREEILESFQHGIPSALFMTLGTGSVGLNLTRASAVILLDPWWNESVENQAIDRAHRIGQTQNVLVKRYMIENSLEQAMDELKNSKKEAVAAWLSHSEASPNFELDLWNKLKQS